MLVKYRHKLKLMLAYSALIDSTYRTLHEHQSSLLLFYTLLKMINIYLTAIHWQIKYDKCSLRDSMDEGYIT